MNIEIFDYTEKSILIKGDTKPLKEKLKELGGRYNPTLGGWIFSKKKKEEIQKSLVLDNNNVDNNLNNKIDNKVENKIENKVENKVENNSMSKVLDTNPTVDNIISTINDMFSEMNHEERFRFVLMITNLACNNPVKQN